MFRCIRRASAEGMVQPSRMVLVRCLGTARGGATLLTPRADHFALRTTGAARPLFSHKQSLFSFSFPRLMALGTAASFLLLNGANLHTSTSALAEAKQGALAGEQNHNHNHQGAFAYAYLACERTSEAGMVCRRLGKAGPGGASRTTESAGEHERRTFIIGDVHGCLDELKALLAKGGFVPSRDVVIFVGDLVGKGVCRFR
jgi:hypothetical protein